MVGPTQMAKPSRTAVQVLDDDDSSVDGFEAVSRSRSASKDLIAFTEDQATESESKDQAQAEEEEEVPDVLYVVEYLGPGRGKILDTIKSSEPFDEIPAYNSNKAKNENKKRPVFEIVTRVNTVPVLQKQGRRTTQRPVRLRPRYNRYGDPHYNHYDDYSDDSDYDISCPRIISRVETPEMIIHSQHLINTLQAVVKYYPYVDIVGKIVSIDAPYRILVHHRKELEAFKHNLPACHDAEYNETVTKHIDLLLNFLEDSMGSQIRDESERHRQSEPVATFENYWMLLKPGEVVLAGKDNSYAPYVISNVKQSIKTDGTPGPYEVVCWSMSYTGPHVTRCMYKHLVQPWNGECPIATLAVIPASFYPNNLEAQQGLPILDWQAKLGRTYWDLLKKPTYLEYSGMVSDTNSINGVNRRAPSGYMSGRIVVDAEGYCKEYYNSDQFHNRPPPPPRVVNRSGQPMMGNGHDGEPLDLDYLPHFEPRCGCEACALAAESTSKIPLYQGFGHLDPLVDTPPDSRIFFIALSPLIPAFIVGDRRWAHVHVADLAPVKTDREAFKWLVLDEEIKTTIRALISEYSNSGAGTGDIVPWANDFVRNKGEGRIFLLHGSPGVGKTCTAEAIAELTGRPLISITTGDLTTVEYQVEAKLSYFLRLGQRYGALVLLDEADVYLERRHSKDLSRNGLVSIFLRALEYYRGVLFLTTNRVQTFDPAFTSRIHVALHYKPLADSDRESIWANNFERLDRESHGKVHASSGVREYAYCSREVASLKWNGREIRNAMQTAVALAAAEARDERREEVVVTDKHLRSVVKMSRGFKDYLRKERLYGGDDVVDDENDENDEEDAAESIFDDE